MMLWFHDHVSLVSQYPSAKAFWIATSVREKLRHAALKIFSRGFRDEIPIFFGVSMIPRPQCEHLMDCFFFLIHIASSFAALLRLVSLQTSREPGREVGRFSLPHLCSVALVTL